MSKVVRYPFDENGKTLTMPQYRLLGLTPFSAWVGILRETWLKPVLYIGLFLLLMIPLALAGEFILRWIYGTHQMPKFIAFIPIILVFILSITILLMMSDRQLVNFIFPSRLWLDSNHFALAMLILLAGILAFIYRIRNIVQKKTNSAKQVFWTNELVISFVVMVAAGLIMLIKIPGLDAVTRFSYTLFDVSLLFILIGAQVTFYTRIVKNTFLQSRQT